MVEENTHTSQYNALNSSRIGDWKETIMGKIGFRAFVTASVFVALIITAISPALAAYTITDLGVGIIPRSINNSGQIAGSNAAGNLVMYSNGSLQDLGTFGGVLTNVHGTAINNNGQIAVDANYSRAYIYDSRTGNLQDMGYTGSFISISSSSISDSGRVTGRFNNPMQNFVYQNGTITNIGQWGNAFPYSLPVINNTGKIAGTASTASGWEPTSYISDLDGSNAVPLGDLSNPTDGTYVTGINDHGDVVGRASLPGGDLNTAHAFLYTAAGGMIDLGSLGGQSNATDINNVDQIVGYYGPSSVRHAFIYEDGVMSDLTSLLGEGSGSWDLICALSINDLGQIVGYGNLNGVSHGFLLTPEGAPVPIPSAFLLLGSGIAGLGIVRRRTIAGKKTSV